MGSVGPHISTNGNCEEHHGEHGCECVILYEVWGKIACLGYNGVPMRLIKG